MKKKASIEADVEVNTLTLIVNAAPNSSGDVVAYARASSKVTLANISAACVIQYRINQAAWVTLGRGDGIDLPINFLIDQLKLRRLAYDGGIASASLVIEGTATVSSRDIVIAKPSGKPFPLDRRNSTSKLRRMGPGGRMGTIDNTTQKTFHVTAELPSGPGTLIGFRPIYGNTNGDYSPYAVSIKASIVTDMSTDAGINNNGAVWGTVLTSSDVPLLLETAPLAGALVYRVAYTMPDHIMLQDLPRTDGGTAVAVAIRCYFDSTAALPASGKDTDSFTNWASRTDGQKWIMRQQSGDQITTPTGFTSTTNVSQSPIIGIEWLYAGKGKTVGSLSDSIQDGRADDNGGSLGDSYVSKAVKLLRDADPAGPALAYSNMSWAGQGAVGPQGFHQRGLDIIGSPVQPDILVFGAGSLNDVITAGVISQWKSGTMRLIDKCRENRVEPIPVTIMPCSYASHPNGANDSMRLAFNSWLLSTCATLGVRCVDVATPMAGAVESHGQQEMNPAYTADLVHPNMAGDDLLAAILAPIIGEAVEL